MPMAGEGSRFATQGYKLPKPLIPVTSPRHGKIVPMVVAAVEDVPSQIEKHIFAFAQDSFDWRA